MLLVFVCMGEFNIHSTHLTKYSHRKAANTTTTVQFCAHLVAPNHRQNKIWGDTSVLNSMCVMFKGNPVSKINCRAMSSLEHHIKHSEACEDLADMHNHWQIDQNWKQKVFITTHCLLAPTNWVITRELKGLLEMVT